MAGKPMPGEDAGDWGRILNNYLDVAHAEDGTIKNNSITEMKLAQAVRAKLNTRNTDVADGSITTAKIDDGAVTNSKVGSNAAIEQTKIDGLVEALASKADADLAWDDLSEKPEVIAAGATQDEARDAIGFDGRVQELIPSSSGSQLAISLRDYASHVSNGDWAPAFEAAIADLPDSGGTLFITSGVSIVTRRRIDIEKPIRIAGDGHRNVQSPLSEDGATEVSSTIFSDHDGPLFYLSHGSNINGFSCHDITLRGRGWSTGSLHAAFAFDIGALGTFRRDFAVTGCTITGFGTAVLVYESSEPSGDSGKQIGAIDISRCNIMHNGFIAQCLNGTSWNGFWFHNNDAGQNGYNPELGGIHVQGHSISIQDNILEGQRDPVKVSGHAGRGLIVRGNYFEANVGEACIFVSDIGSGLDIGPNKYGVLQTKHKVFVFRCGVAGIVRDPYFPQGSTKITPAPGVNSGIDENYRLLNTQLDDGEFFLFADSPRPEDLITPRNLLSPPSWVTPSSDSVVSANSPYPSIRGGAPAIERTLPANGLISTTSQTSGQEGDIIVVTWVVRRIDVMTGLYISLRIDGQGLAETPHYSLSRSTRDNEWITITMAAKAPSSFSQVGSFLYPYGMSEGGGKIVHFLNPTFYTTDDINAVKPHVASFGKLAGPPTSGTWQAGDSVVRREPTDGVYMDVCIEGGSPGVWGSVQAS